MAQGVLVGNVCFADALAATDAYFSSVTPTPFAHYEKNTDTWYLVTYNASGVLASSSVAAVPSLPSCDSLAGFNDGLTIGAGLAAALVLASISGILSKAL